MFALLTAVFQKVCTRLPCQKTADCRVSVSAPPAAKRAERSVCFARVHHARMPPACALYLTRVCKRDSHACLPMLVQLDGQAPAPKESGSGCEEEAPCKLH